MKLVFWDIKILYLLAPGNEWDVYQPHECDFGICDCDVEENEYFCPFCGKKYNWKKDPQNEKIKCSCWNIVLPDWTYRQRIDQYKQKKERYI